MWKKLRSHARSFIGFALLLILAGASRLNGADVIPAERLRPWRVGETIGVIGGKPSGRTQWTNFVEAGADASGVTNNVTIFNTLNAACPSNQYIYVPDGYYRFSNAITTLKSGVSVVGQSSNAVFFYKTAFINHDGTFFAAPIHIASHLAVGDTNVTLRTPLDSGYVGKLARISSENYGRTNAQVMSSGHHDRSLNQYPRIDSITDGTNLTIWPPIITATATNLNPWLHANASAPAEYWGFENITFTGTNVSTGEVYDNNNIITISAARNWWFHNCTFINPRNGFQFNLLYNTFGEIRHSRFFSAGSGANTSVIIASSDTGLLIENNYNYGGNPFAQMNNQSGFVVAYNHITNAVADDVHLGNPLDIHQPHSHGGLWEGNDGSQFSSDAYHGSSSDQVLYRNRLHAYDPIKNTSAALKRAVDIGRWSTNYTVVANDLGSTNGGTYHYTTTNQFYDNGSFGNITGLIFRFGYPNTGNSSYGENVGGGPYNAIKTPERSYNYPGTNYIVCVVTQATALTNIVWGDFDRTLPEMDNGPRVVAQSAANTNYYYYWNTNSNLKLEISAQTETNITLSHTVWVTNGDSLYLIGPNAWPHLDLQGTNGHLIEANFVVSNAANATVRWTGATNEAGLPSSYYLTERPAWFTNKNGGAMAWPPFGVATVGDSALTNRLPAESLQYDLAEGGGEDPPPATGGVLNGTFIGTGQIIVR